MSDEMDEIEKAARAVIDQLESLSMSQTLTVIGLVAGAVVAQAMKRSDLTLDEIIERHGDNIRQVIREGIVASDNDGGVRQ